MSEENFPAESSKSTDLTEKDMVRVNDFISQGMPGIDRVDDQKLYRMLDMYLSGRTYNQISSSIEIKKPIVMYLSHKFDWYGTKREYLNDLQEHIKVRVIDAKLVNKDFMLLLVQAWQKKIGSKLTKYLTTNDDSHMDEIDIKEVSQLMKAIEMVNELDKDGKSPKGTTPAVGLNVGDGVTIEKTGENSITISPKENTIGDMLKKFADSRREEERKSKPEKSSDISNDTKGAPNENK